MKIVKKFLAIALCLTMLLGIIPFGMVGASAVGEDAVTATINAIKAQFPDGKYFTKDGKRCEHADNMVGPVDSKGNYSYCSNCLLSSVLEKNGISSKGYSNGRTCFALASYCFTKCFGLAYCKSNYKKFDSDDFAGIKYAQFNAASNATKYNFFKQAKIGDIIQLFNYSDGHYYNCHYMVFISCDSTGITVYDNNVGGTHSSPIRYSADDNKGHVTVTSNGKYVAYTKGYTGKIREGKISYSSLNYNNVEIQHANNYASSKPTAATPTKETENTDNGVKLRLRSTTGGRTIYYTTDGSTPTTPNSKTTNKSSVKYDEGWIVLNKTTTVKAITYKSGYSDSSVATFNITVNKASTPKITSAVTANGFNVTITAGSGETIYYTTDGSNPTTSSTKYTAGFTVSENATVKAIAVKSGCTGSDVASLSLTASVPAAPQLKLESLDTIGIGDTVELSWNAVEGAASYKLIVSGPENEIIDYGSNVAAYELAKAGTYSFSVKAVNFKGESAASAPAVAVTVKSDVTVTFEVDGKVYATQKVHYGKSAVAPASPSKEGHNFVSWSGDYTNVTKDTTVSANFKAIPYTITFEDNNGNTIGKPQSVEYGNSATAPSVTSVTPPDGYEFTGWTLSNKDGDKGTSYTNVDGDATFKPVFTWATPGLPVAAVISSAIRSDDSKSYNVSIKVSNERNQVYFAKVITVIKTANDKVVATDISNITIQANANSAPFNVTVTSNEDAMLCEVYIVNSDETNPRLTGGALSAKVSKAVTRTASTTTYTWSEWSDWSTTPKAENDTTDVDDPKTQYRYRDKETTTAKTSTLDGWTQTGKNVTYGNWSAWDDVVLTANATTEVQKAVIYRYYYYACASCGNRQPYWNCACTKCGKHVDNSKRDYMCSDVSYSKVSSSKYDGYKRVTTQFDNGKKWFFSSGNINDTKVGTIDASGSAQVIFNGYRKRTINTTYSFERWTPWSAWSDTKYEPIQDSREVQTQTLYRYRTLKANTSSSSTEYIVDEETTGTVYTKTGTIKNLDKGVDYSGQKATVMVYRGNNTDPTAEQLEYVGQVTLGSGNSYSFKFIPLEEISESTGDYIISFGIAGSDKLINNVDRIEAPKPIFKVEFHDLNGNIIKSQDVAKGSDATAPELPESDGYIVTWDLPYTNITSNKIITAVTKPVSAKTVSVVFIDYENRTSKQEQVKYGSTVKVPDNPTTEGKIFKRWSIDANSKITETTIVEAIYEDVTFTVDFLNKDGSVFETQTVPYGGYASVPENAPTAEGFEFVAWDSGTAWWNIKADTTVKPIFIYDKTVETPVSTNDTVNFSCAALNIETSTEGAEIRYTTDGSEPTQESFLFDDIVFVEQTTTFKAKAFKDGMNDSSTAEFVIEVLDESESPAISVLTGNNYLTVGETTASVCARIDNPQKYPITDMGLIITNSVTGETKTIAANPLPSVTDKPVGQKFNLTNLEKGTTYEYEFYIIFDVDGEDYYLSTGPSFAGDIVDSFTTLGTVPPVPTGYSVKIKTPSTTTVKYGYTLVLHAEVEGTLPEGAKVVWKETSGEAFKATASGLTAKATSTVKGEKTITVCIVDADGNVLKNENGEDIQDSVTLTAKVSFFTKLAYFFKHLFGANLTIDA